MGSSRTVEPLSVTGWTVGVGTLSPAARVREASSASAPTQRRSTNAAMECVLLNSPCEPCTWPRLHATQLRPAAGQHAARPEPAGLAARPRVDPSTSGTEDADP